MSPYSPQNYIKCVSFLLSVTSGMYCFGTGRELSLYLFPVILILFIIYISILINFFRKMGVIIGSNVRKIKIGSLIGACGSLGIGILDYFPTYRFYGVCIVVFYGIIDFVIRKYHITDIILSLYFISSILMLVFFIIGLIYTLIQQRFPPSLFLLLSFSMLSKFYYETMISNKDIL